MKEFIFAFPLAESLENVSVFLEKLQIRKLAEHDAGEWVIVPKFSYIG